MGSTQSTWGLHFQVFSQPLNMKSMILIAVFLAVAAAAPQDQRPVAIILKQTQNHDTEQQKFSYSFESDDGIAVSANGIQKQIGEKAEEAGIVSNGAYSYSLDGVTYSVNWVADENGFVAKGDHLPTPPPMPAHVVKILEDLRAEGKL